MKNSRTGKITMTALFAAIVFVATLMMQIPIAPTGGYVHPGDAFVILAGIFLGPWYGALAGGVGAMLADLTSGYVIYAPVTFLVKAVMAFGSFLVFLKISGKKEDETSAKQNHEWIACLFAGIVAAMINVAGYFIFEWFLYGKAALFAIPGNSIQGLSGIVISMLLYPVIKRAYLALPHMQQH